MKYIFFLFPIFLQAQCLIPTHSYRLICADEVRYADSIASGSRLYISSRNAYVTSPRSVFSLVNGYGQHFIQITNSANSQKVAINRAWINRIDSTSSNKALIYIKDISVTFTTVESYTSVKDSAIACFVRAVASGLATLSDGDYGDVVVSGGGLVMTVDKPDLGLHNLADGDFSVTADSTALSLTNTRQITFQTKNIDNWIARLLITNNSITLRTNSTGKNSRVFVDSTGANFQFVNGSNNASLRVGDSVAVRFNTSGSVGQVLTVTSIDGDGRLVINPKTGGSGTANCEQTITKNSHGFRKWTPIYWNGSAWARPTYDSIIPTYIVVDSTTVNTFKVANCGNYSSTLTAGLYYYTGTSPGYTLTQPEIKTPLFEVAQSRLILQPIIGFNLSEGSGGPSIANVTYTSSDSTSTGGNPSTVSGVVNILKYTGNGSNAVPSFGLVPNFYNENGTISTERTTTLSGSNGDYFKLNGTSNSKVLDLYFSSDGQYNNDSYFTFEMSKTNQTNNLGNFNWSHYVYGSSGKTYSIGFNGTAQRSSSGNTGVFYDMDLRRASGTFITKHLMQIDSVGRFYNYLEFKSDSLSGAGRKHISGFAYKTQTSGQTVIVAPTKSWLLQTNFYNSSTKFDWLRVDNLDTDTTSNRITFYNNKYAFPNARPSATSSAISNLIWTAGTPSFLRSQHGVATGTTDGSGDLTVTFAAAMPDATYSLIATVEGTTSYTISVHTKATGTCKVRFFNPTTGAAVTATSVTISYEAKDY